MRCLRIVPKGNVALLTSSNSIKGTPPASFVLCCRGGYCYESNNLLAKALKTLGFDVYSVGARNVDEKSAEVDRSCCSYYTPLYWLPPVVPVKGCSCMLIQLRHSLGTGAWLAADSQCTLSHRNHFAMTMSLQHYMLTFPCKSTFTLHLCLKVQSQTSWSCSLRSNAAPMRLLWREFRKLLPGMWWMQPGAVGHLTSRSLCGHGLTRSP